MAKLGSSSIARLRKGSASASPLCCCVVTPMLKVFSASREGVVASIGTSNFCTEASDSPSFIRRLAAALPTALTASSFVATSTCSLANVSPLPQFTASSASMYSLPSREIEPEISALVPVRKQISCPTSRVTRSLEVRPIKRKVSRILRSESTLRKGDCPKSTSNACFNVPSKTESPVLLSKSARTIASFSVSCFTVCER